MQTAWGSDWVIAGAGKDRAVCAGNRPRSVKERENACAKRETVTASSLPSQLSREIKELSLLTRGQ